MEDAGLARRLRQGLWTLHADIDPFILAPYLTAPFPAYVSFWSALARYDMIEQIPRQISVASMGQPDRHAATADAPSARTHRRATASVARNATVTSYRAAGAGRAPRSVF
jgi:predicted transcriptional regulator of viral defense system